MSPDEEAFQAGGGPVLPADDRDAETRRAEERFIDDLLVRGQAVYEGEELPQGATHEIVLGEDGRRTAHRRRFSAY